MNVRRAIAALLTLAFTLVLCAPAFAGVATLAAHADDACGCTEQQPRPTLEHRDDVACHCAGCGCSIEELPTPTPYDGVATTPSVAWVAVPADVAPLDTVQQPIALGDTATNFARGPPDLHAAPLYIQYASFLI